MVGLNVTIPHKESILSYLDEISPEARAIGASNVVHVRDSRLFGFNTDVLGVGRTLTENHCDMRGKKTRGFSEREALLELLPIF